MNAEELEKIVARHEMQCLELKESFNVECIETACRSSYIDKEGMMAEEENKIILYTTADGKRYNVIYYALEMILAVGFRVRGVRGTQKGTRRLTTSGARRRLVLPTRRIWRSCDESRRRRSNAAEKGNELLPGGIDGIRR